MKLSNVRRFDVLEGESWTFKDMPKGKRQKYDLRPNQTGVAPEDHWQWFWKAAKEAAPFETWSEVIACLIGDIIGVEVPDYYPSKFDDLWGVLTKSFLPGFPSASSDNVDILEIRFVAGADILADFENDYDREKGTNASVQAFHRAKENLRELAVEKGYRIKFGQTEDFEQKFFSILLLDSLIGNQDRHHENWGVVYRNEIYWDPNMYPIPIIDIMVSPAFDNGASLMRELKDDEHIRNILKRSTLQNYAKNCKSEVKWQEGSTYHHLTHFEFLQKHFLSFPWSIDIAKRALSFDNDELRVLLDKVQAISRECEGIEISDYRTDILFDLLCLRKQMILKCIP